MKFLTVSDVLVIHDRYVEEYGGSLGVRDEKLLESAVFRCQSSFGGEDLYRTLFEKAAALFHGLIFDHPFIDGNKRSGAFAFIWFLRRNGVRGARNINPSGLTAITLLIAESDPKHKDKMVALVVELLRVNKNK